MMRLFLCLMVTYSTLWSADKVPDVAPPHVGLETTIKSLRDNSLLVAITTLSDRERRLLNARWDIFRFTADPARDQQLNLMLSLFWDDDKRLGLALLIEKTLNRRTMDNLANGASAWLIQKSITDPAARKGTESIGNAMNKFRAWATSGILDERKQSVALANSLIDGWRTTGIKTTEDLLAHDYESLAEKLSLLLPAFKTGMQGYGWDIDSWLDGISVSASYGTEGSQLVDLSLPLFGEDIPVTIPFVWDKDANKWVIDTIGQAQLTIGGFPLAKPPAKK